VWHETYGYLPSCRAPLPLDWYHIILHKRALAECSSDCLGCKPVGYTTEVCEAWPVWRQTYGYLPSCRASPPLDWYRHHTAWWQRHMCVNNLPKVAIWKRNSQKSNPRPSKRYSYFSIGDGQPRKPALCQLYRHTFVHYTDGILVGKSGKTRAMHHRLQCFVQLLDTGAELPVPNWLRIRTKCFSANMSWAEVSRLFRTV